MFLVMSAKNVLRDKSQLHMLALHSQSLLMLDTMDFLKHRKSPQYYIKCHADTNRIEHIGPIALEQQGFPVIVAVACFVIKFKGNRAEPE